MHYANAPITEAALDIYVRLPSDVSLEALESAYAGEEENYPIKKSPFKAEFKLGINPEQGDATADVEKTPLGYVFFTQDQKQAFQARLDGFTHNRLAPYNNWNSFRGEASRLWQRYKSAASPEAIDLIGLHYANVIDVPLAAKVSEYFNTYIFLGNGLPQMMEGFSLSVQMLFNEFDARLALVQTYAPPRRADMASILLDIRVFRQVGRVIADFDDAQMWQAFEQLRKAKNTAFEGCITDRVREALR